MLQEGDGVEIRASGWPATVIALDDNRALVRWIKKDGGVEEHWYPMAGLRKLPVEEALEVEVTNFSDGSRSRVTGY